MQRNTACFRVAILLAWLYFLVSIRGTGGQSTPLFPRHCQRLYWTHLSLSSSSQQQHECLLFNPLRLSLISSAGLRTQAPDTVVLLCGSAGLIDLLWRAASCMPITAQARWNGSGLSEGGICSGWIWQFYSPFPESVTMALSEMNHADCNPADNKEIYSWYPPAK